MTAAPRVIVALATICIAEASLGAVQLWQMIR